MADLDSNFSKFQLFDNLEDGVIIINSKSIIEYVNPEVLNIFDYERNEMIGKHLSMIMFPSDAKIHDNYVQKFIDFAEGSALRKGKELVGRNKNNFKIPVYISVIKYNSEGDIKLISFLKDLSKPPFSIEKKKDEKLKTLTKAIDLSPNGTLIANKDGFIEYINNSLLKMLNLNYDEVIGKNLFNEEYLISKEINLDIFSELKQNITWKSHVKKDNKNLFITIYGVNNSENEIINIVETVEDYTNLLETYEKIEGEKNKLQSILSSIPEGILLLDSENFLIQSNSKLAEIYYSLYEEDLKEIILDKNLFELNQDNNFISILKTMIKKDITNQIIKPSTNLTLRIYLIKEKFGKIFVIYDTTKEENLNEFRENLVSTVSHELRNPISAIQSSIINLIKYDSKITNDQRDKLLNISYDNSLLLGNIVDDLLLLASIENNKLKLSFTENDLTGILKEVIQLLLVKAHEKNVKIEMLNNESYFLHCDSKRLAQVLRILIDNAIKYSKPDSKVEISLNKKFSDLPINGILEINIRDYGIGIQETDFPGLFTRFYRGKNASNFKGTGLGLAIAKDLIDLHGGVIEVESKINEGSIFSIRLPLIQTN